MSLYQIAVYYWPVSIWYRHQILTDVQWSPWLLYQILYPSHSVSSTWTLWVPYMPLLTGFVFCMDYWEWLHHTHNLYDLNCESFFVILKLFFIFLSDSSCWSFSLFAHNTFSANSLSIADFGNFKESKM